MVADITVPEDIVDEAVAVHPEALVTVTVYVPAPTLIVCVVAPVLHRYDVAEDEDSVMFVPQYVPLEGVTPALVGVFIVTTTAADVPVHPAPSVTVTRYDPDVVTLILCVTAPLLQT